MSETKAQEKARLASEARDYLRELFPVGSVVPVLVRHVTSSGMSRSISVLHGDGDGNVTDVSWSVARATGSKLDDRHGGVKVGGAGMDMGFALVYDLARTLYRDNFHCIGEDAGYALTHKWVN